MKTADRMVQVLSLFTETSPDQSVASIAAATGLATSSTHALLAGFVEAGILRRCGRRYGLGPLIVQLSGVLVHAPPIRTIAHDALKRLAETSQDRTMLLVERDGKLVEDSVFQARCLLCVQDGLIDAINANAASVWRGLFRPDNVTGIMLIDRQSVIGAVCLALRLSLPERGEQAAVAMAVPESRYMATRNLYTSLLNDCARKIAAAARQWPILPLQREAI